MERIAYAILDGKKITIGEPVLVDVRYFCECPSCGEKLTIEEAESVCDEGCPACRTLFDVEDYKLD